VIDKRQVRREGASRRGRLSRKEYTTIAVPGVGWRNPCCGTSHPAETPEALWRGRHERFVLPHGARCLPRRRGSDTLTYWLPLVPVKGMAGHQIVYRPLAGGKIVCTSPSPASTVRAGG
jgi:hypothetical protein